MFSERSDSAGNRECLSSSVPKLITELDIIKFVLFSNLIFTALKRSLGQGNVFRRVCNSVHRGGGLPERDQPGKRPPP